jgi:hypothetical protein
LRFLLVGSPTHEEIEADGGGTFPSQIIFTPTSISVKFVDGIGVEVGVGVIVGVGVWVGVAVGVFGVGACGGTVASGDFAMEDCSTGSGEMAKAGFTTWPGQLMLAFVKRIGPLLRLVIVQRKLSA